MLKNDLTPWAPIFNSCQKRIFIRKIVVLVLSLEHLWLGDDGLQDVRERSGSALLARLPCARACALEGRSSNARESSGPRPNRALKDRHSRGEEARRPICCLAILVFAHNFVKEQNRPRFQLCESRIRFLHLREATLINGEHCRVPDPHGRNVTSGRKDRIGNLDHFARAGEIFLKWI